MKILMMLLAALTVNGQQPIISTAPIPTPQAPVNEREFADGVPVASDIPGMSVTHIHVDRVPHDESTDIHYSDFHLFLTLDNQTGKDIQIVWAKVCFTIAKDPVCKEIQVSRDWEKGGWESKGHEWWTGQMPTEVELLRVGTSRAKGD